VHRVAIELAMSVLFLLCPANASAQALNTPTLATMDFRILKYFPLGGAKRLGVVAEFFNLFNSANACPINPVFGSGLTPCEFERSFKDHVDCPD